MIQPYTHNSCNSALQRLAAATEEAEVLRKQVEHLQAALEANEVARPTADAEALAADLKSARRRIAELEDAARPAPVAPALGEPLLPRLQRLT